ncbi:ABC transporter ATP-binding protein [Rubrimonas cliftonensis]|uniref:Amino acid/amide ABC transporter ATP-binding protein 2, HAAT family n=1 Tax=Rubrimonas cliftonensis TaxID=89524 RepID=A0A1H3XKL7_9RHOB|nr:ABC transporter ATP-binding protein [Rubrimonas cliftonensis]SDZ99164.1 amino acid/amide ABC transporter ATP-binding protein 2, HAAT family [Rubrimonas cliftonensis]
MSVAALEVRGLEVRYGPVRAVRGVDLDVAPGGVTALLGANGAGKTTTLMAAAGARRFAAGSVTIFGRDMTGADPEAVVRAGVAISPEGRRVFASLSVEENLTVAGAVVPDRALARGRRAEMMERFPILGERRRQLAGLLSGGEQQMLAVARALMSGPRLLLLDEPSLGLAPRMVDRIFEIVEALRAEGIAVLLVEQNAALALEVADRAVVLANGAVAAAGTPAEIADDALLRSAYLAA